MGKGGGPPSASKRGSTDYRYRDALRGNNPPTRLGERGNSAKESRKASGGLWQLSACTQVTGIGRKSEAMSEKKMEEGRNQKKNKKRNNTFLGSVLQGRGTRAALGPDERGQIPRRRKEKWVPIWGKKKERRFTRGLRSLRARRRLQGKQQGESCNKNKRKPVGYSATTRHSCGARSALHLGNA